jgi:hypothetical protein
MNKAQAILVKSYLDEDKIQNITISFKEEKEAKTFSSLQDAIRPNDNAYRNIAPSILTYNMNALIKECLGEVSSIRLNFEDATLKNHLTIVNQSLQNLWNIPSEKVEIKVLLSYTKSSSTKKKEKKENQEKEAEVKEIVTFLIEHRKKRDEQIKKQQEERKNEENKQQIFKNNFLTNISK